MRRGLAALTVLALFLPGALAGNESDPEVDDARDHRDASLDLLAGWFSPDTKGVRLTVKVAALEDKLDDHAYFMSFTLHGARYLAAVGFDGTGTLRGHVGVPPASRDIRGLETFEQNLRDLSYRPGKPGYVTGVIPWGAVDGLEPGAVLVDIVAGTSLYHRDRATWEGNVDVRGTDRTYTTQRVLLPPGWIGPLAAGAGVLALTGIGLAVVLVARRRRAAPPPAVRVPVEAPPQEPPAPPREPVKPRFSLRPPT